jgi:glucose/mannose-6-phosphate isomerase
MTMDKLIAAFPTNIKESLEIASKVTFKAPKHTIQNVLICGMGGSGIGGKLVSQWLQDELNVPVQLVQDYTFPSYVNKNTLVIGSSYSGETEETLYCVEKALEVGAHIIGICSGGKLAAFCENNELDYILVPGGNPPRTALAFSLGQLINIFVQLGFVNAKNLDSFRKSADLLNENEAEIKAEAHKLAAFLKDTFVMIYAASNYEAVAIRARQQFNENGKILCCHHTIPEMNHNELVGWGLGDNKYGALFLDSEDWHERNVTRLQFSIDVIKTKTENVFVLKAKGEDVIQRSIYLINVVDWASFYLSELNNVDATEIDVINNLKGKLSSLK